MLLSVSATPQLRGEGTAHRHSKRMEIYFASVSPLSKFVYHYYLSRIKCSTKHTPHKCSIQVEQTKGEMQSADKTTIKAKVMHVYVSTTVLANDIQILRFISYRVM